MGTATLLSRILGLVREQVFAILFGAGNMTDAFNLAFRVPNVLRNLFAEGSMSAALVPTFTRARQEKGARAAWRVAGLVFRVLFVTVAALSLLGMLFAPELVGLYASAFKQVPGKFELTVRMTRIMFPFFPLVALAAAFMAILNACGVFFLPAFASALFNLTAIVVGVALVSVLNHSGAQWGMMPIEGMAFGVLAGGLVQAFCQLPALYRVGYRWPKRAPEDPEWSDDPNLRRMMWMMVPGTVGLAATQVNLLINTVLATGQGTGAVSYLSYAFRLMQFPIGIFGASLAQATLPLISRQWVERDVAGVRMTLQQGLGRVFAINLPASAGLAFLGVPIIELIFQYGRFYAENTQATAMALAMYAAGLTAYSAVKLLVPACYALGNARIPVISSVISVIATLCLNLLMVRPFGYWGLALGTSLGAILNAIFLLYALRGLLVQAGEGFALRPVARSFFTHLAIALVMGVACFFSHRLLNSWLPDLFWVNHLGQAGWVVSRFFKVGVVVFEGIALILILGRSLGAPETAEAVDIFAKKLKNKLSRAKT
jgi:putative peptidoglycan lipid II flippase